MIDLTNIETKDLIRVHNECAEKLGAKPVTRFSDRTTAEKRTRFVLSQISPSQRPAPFTEGDPNEMKGSVRAKDAPHAAIKSITSVSGKGLEATQLPKDANISVSNGHVADSVMAVQRRQAASKAGAAAAEKSRRQAAAVAIAASPTPDAPVKPSLPIPSGDAAKDAEMPALRQRLRPVELKPKARIFPRKEGSKQAILVDMLSRPGGATFGELYDALSAAGSKPWKGVTIRSGLAWDMNNIAGYGITTEMLDGMQLAAHGREYEARRVGVEYKGNGYGPGPAYDPEMKQAVYRLVYPKGMTGPLPHTPRKGPTPQQKAAAKKALEGALADASKKGA